MPLIGALLDSSNHRRLVGGLTALAVTVFTFIQSFVSERNWFPLFILNLLSFLTLSVNGCVGLAYLPELTRDITKLERYNAVIMIYSSVTTVIFLIAMTVVSTIMKNPDDTILMAQIALLTTFFFQVVFYGISWTRLFGVRQAAHGSTDITESKPRCHLLHSGIRSLKRTLVKAFKQRSEVRWFLIFRATSQPVVIAFTAAALSYINELQVSPRNIGITTLIVLASAVPGNKLSLMMMHRFNPLWTLKLCTFLWMGLASSFVWIVNEPGQETRLLLVGILWGLILGMKEPADKTILCNLVPKGIEAEMSGLYIFASQILMWLPPLVFTLMNENGVDIQIAITCFGGYFLIALVALNFMGRYDAITAGTEAHEKEEILDLIGLRLGRSMSENDLTTFAHDRRRRNRLRESLQRSDSTMSMSSFS